MDQVKKIIGTHVLTGHEHMAGPSTWIVLTNPQPVFTLTTVTTAMQFHVIPLYGAL